MSTCHKTPAADRHHARSGKGNAPDRTDRSH